MRVASGDQTGGPGKVLSVRKAQRVSRFDHAGEWWCTGADVASRGTTEDASIPVLMVRPRKSRAGGDGAA